MPSRLPDAATAIGMGMERATIADETSHLLEVRREKLERIRSKGLEPFQYGFSRSHGLNPARELFETQEAEDRLDEDAKGERVRVAGRLVSFRSHGRSAFAHMEDASGKLQAYFRKNVLGEEAFADLELLDLGDWVGLEGRLFRTRTGEVTVEALEWHLLTKSLRPLPIPKVEEDPETGERKVYSGFSDTQSRYRQRYADLAVHPEVREIFRTRSRIVGAIRAFLDERDYLEVETPILQPLYGGAAARPFVTHHNALDRPFYLRIADELYLKRLLVGGFERVYEIGKDFRNEGVDRSHNPEFTMLEFYEAFSDYRDMMDGVEALLQHVAREAVGSEEVLYQGRTVSFASPFRRLSFVEALEAELGASPLDLSHEELRSRAEALELPDLTGAGRGKLLDKLFGELVEPGLQDPTFVVDYPRELSPLAKGKRGDDRLTERFELYVAGQEVANAFSELNDPDEQRARLEDQARLHAEGDEEAHPVDEDFVRALEYGMPPTGGVGLGVDRLTMILTDQASIREVILFPALRT